MFAKAMAVPCALPADTAIFGRQHSMSDMSSVSRERKKRELKKQMISSGQSRPDSGNHNEGRKKRKRGHRLLKVLLLFAIIGVGAAGIYYYFGNHQFTEYVVGWEKPIQEGGAGEYKNFGSNVLKYTKDGMSYINDKGETVWMQSYEMKNPIASVNGNYAVVADQQGNSIYICDVTGVLGQASTVLPVIKAVVSQTGVAAAILEDSKANYIQYYNKDGSTIDLTIKTALSGDGYPLDAALSPDGNQTIASIMYLSGGELKNRVVFYDFSEIGKNQKHLVGGFDQEFSDSIAARVIYPDDTHACAFTDQGISFFSSKNRAAVELTSQVPADGTVETVFYSNKYAGLIAKTSGGENPYRMDLYKVNGDRLFSAEFNFPYEHVDLSDDMVILYNEESCMIYGLNGKVKYSGSLGMEIAKINQGRSSNSVIVCSPQTMKEIRFR